MAVSISSLDRFKVETEFGEGYVVQTTYDWEFSERRLKEISTWTEVRLIGSGAFGSVWLEQKKEGGQLRAVKKLRREFLKRTGFSQELVALVTLADYKHLFVEFFGWYESNREIFLAMEYVQYGDLSEYMKDHETARAEAREVTRQILEGLKILHGEGICHRDLKPQNILVASRDPIWVKLADFGASKRTNNTVLRTMCGTRGYLAPEVQGLLPRRFKTGVVFSYALDLWSLGCVVYEMLTTQIPFLEIGDDDEDDDMTGLDSSFDIPGGEVDMDALYEYCQGVSDLPCESLHTAQVTEEGIQFVKSLMVPNPMERATAASALQDQWIVNTGYTSNWYNALVSDFSGMGIDLDLGSNRVSLRQLRSVDIARVLPKTVNLGALLEQAVVGGFNTAALVLIGSSSRELSDPSGLQNLWKQVVLDGRIECVKILLSTDTDSRLIQYDGLIVAVEGGWTDIVQLLLANKADVNTRFSNGRTALQTACEKDNAEIVKILLSNKADVDTQSSDGRTPLVAAVENGNIEIVTILLANNASVNSRSVNGWPVLHIAAMSGHTNLVKLLLDNKAAINYQPNRTGGRTPLQAASSGGHIDVVKILLDSKADINTKASDREGRTALQAAAGGGHINVVKLLLDSKANINAEPGDWDGRTALQAAAGGGHIDVVKLLLDSKVTINAKACEWKGRTALQAAAGGGYIDVVKLLLDSEAAIDAEACNWEGRTALQAAAGAGHIDVVKLLLNSKAAVNDEPGYWEGRTALQAAAGDGYINVVKFLLNSKAAVNGEPGYWEGRTALQAAAGGGYIDVVKILLDSKASINAEPGPQGGRTALQAAAAGGHIDAVRLLLGHNASVNAPAGAEDGRTALQAAAGGGHIDVVKLLLNSKADINAEPGRTGGRTALQAAAGGGHIDVVELLLGLKADINAEACEWEGRTALQAAAGGGYIDVVKLLLDSKADINAKACYWNGQTALEAATEGRHTPVVRLLLDSGATSLENYDSRPRFRFS
ncbi:hypothetical protein Q9L58_006073 [Maublancomyces gigas]|uniref:protein S-acyltransferase n=1 Tax=Discina gigas TaxID=1032678 RepID=A0ABR3GG96_9PEZI